MAVSIKDIAKIAGVSPSTVSRALNNHPRISEGTKAHIQQLAKEMGYVPSSIARSLAVQRSATIGVAVTDLTDPYYIGLIQGIEKAIAAHTYQMLLNSFYRDPDRELEVVYDFHQRRVDGVIVTGSYIENIYLDPDNNFFKPVVIINSLTYPHSVAVDRATGMRKLIKHLIDLGHRRIAHVTQPRDGMERLEGYRVALEAHGISVDPALIVPCDGGIMGGLTAAPVLMNLAHPPTAISCFNDLTAIGVINALHRHKCRVPQDISVTGFDDLEMSAYYNPSLTTVRQPANRVGERAVEMLIRLINHKNNVEPEIVQPRLMFRDSTAPVSLSTATSS